MTQDTPKHPQIDPAEENPFFPQRIRPVSLPALSPSSVGRITRSDILEAKKFS